MFNRFRSAHAVTRHWRKGAVVTAVAATAVAFSGSGVAVAHGLIDSGRIQNQTIQSVDIGHNQVGASELGAGQGDNAAVRTEHIKDNGIRPDDLGDNFLGDALDDTPESHAAGGEDEVVDLDPGERKLVKTLPGAPGKRLVVASVTVSGNDPNDNLLCFLDTPGTPEELAAANAKTDREAFALTAIATDTEVTLECQAGAGGTATDISMVAVDVQ